MGFHNESFKEDGSGDEVSTEEHGNRLMYEWEQALDLPRGTRGFR
jgi:hypothetical protein